MNTTTRYHELLADSNLYHLLYGQGTRKEQRIADRLWKQSIREDVNHRFSVLQWLVNRAILSIDGQCTITRLDLIHAYGIIRRAAVYAYRLECDLQDTAWMRQEYCKARTIYDHLACAVDFIRLMNADTDGNWSINRGLYALSSLLEVHELLDPVGVVSREWTHPR